MERKKKGGESASTLIGEKEERKGGGRSGTFIFDNSGKKATNREGVVSHTKKKMGEQLSRRQTKKDENGRKGPTKRSTRRGKQTKNHTRQ